jgi:hypothetical protein
MDLEECTVNTREGMANDPGDIRKERVNAAKSVYLSFLGWMA